MPLVSSGVEHGNIRELALARMAEYGTSCRDVRTREVGIQEIHQKIRPFEVELVRRDYVANGGWETFLAFEDVQQDILIGLLRLRKCSSETFRPELVINNGTLPNDTNSKPKYFGGCSIVRELHVYGSVVPVNIKDPIKFQHQGFGMLLMEEAERIARKEHGSSKITVISGKIDLNPLFLIVLMLILISQVSELAITTEKWATSWTDPTCLRVLLNSFCVCFMVNEVLYIFRSQLTSCSRF